MGAERSNFNDSPLDNDFLRENQAVRTLFPYALEEGIQPVRVETRLDALYTDQAGSFAQKDNQGRNLLWYAMYAGDIAAFNWILELMPELLVEPNRNGTTLLKHLIDNHMLYFLNRSFENMASDIWMIHIPALERFLEALTAEDKVNITAHREQLAEIVRRNPNFLRIVSAELLDHYYQLLTQPTDQRNLLSIFEIAINNQGRFDPNMMLPLLCDRLNQHAPEARDPEQTVLDQLLEAQNPRMIATLQRLFAAYPELRDYVREVPAPPARPAAAGAAGLDETTRQERMRNARQQLENNRREMEAKRREEEAIVNLLTSLGDTSVRISDSPGSPSTNSSSFPRASSSLLDLKAQTADHLARLQERANAGPAPADAGPPPAAGGVRHWDRDALNVPNANPTAGSAGSSLGTHSRTPADLPPAVVPSPPRPAAAASPHRFAFTTDQTRQRDAEEEEQRRRTIAGRPDQPEAAGDNEGPAAAGSPDARSPAAASSPNRSSGGGGDVSRSTGSYSAADDEEAIRRRLLGDLDTPQASPQSSPQRKPPGLRRTR